MQRVFLSAFDKQESDKLLGFGISTEGFIPLCPEAKRKPFAAIAYLRIICDFVMRKSTLVNRELVQQVLG